MSDNKKELDFLSAREAFIHDKIKTLQSYMLHHKNDELITYNFKKIMHSLQYELADIRSRIDKIHHEKQEEIKRIQEEINNKARKVNESEEEIYDEFIF